MISNSLQTIHEFGCSLAHKHTLNSSLIRPTCVKAAFVYCGTICVKWLDVQSNDLKDFCGLPLLQAITLSFIPNLDTDCFTPKQTFKFQSQQKVPACSCVLVFVFICQNEMKTPSVPNDSFFSHHLKAEVNCLASRGRLSFPYDVWMQH